MPVSSFSVAEKYLYQYGFGSHHETEALKGALPIGQNSPQIPPFGLYTEKLSGTAFTAPRAENKQSWLYRILPAAAHKPFVPLDSDASNDSTFLNGGPYHQIPNQLRWDPFNFDEKADWISGLHSVGGVGEPSTKTGLGILFLAAGRDMPLHQAYYSADGDFLIVLQHGVLDIQTEMGRILLRTNEIAVIPRGIRYRVTLPNGPVRAYILELYDGHFELPELGPIGSNGLANARDFQVPVANFHKEEKGTKTRWDIVVKFNNKLYSAQQFHSPFDVVSWHGNYYPYNIYTVLTAQSARAGTAIADFVIFPPRWLVMDNTFRPPWYHRNTMSEFMGLIQGDYDAKTGGGFKPAGASLHNIMTAHGPDAETHEKASKAVLQPMKVGEGSMAFMFESSLMIGVTSWGLRNGNVQNDYNEESWVPLESHFVPT